jgi:hypothetical protein
LLPVAVEAWHLATNIRAGSREEIAAQYDHPDRGAGPPRQVRARTVRIRSPRHRAALFEQGHWIGNCQADITLPMHFPELQPPSEPISDPPPEQIERITHDSITLRYAEVQEETIRVRLRVLEEFRFDVPSEPSAPWTAVRTADLQNDRLTLTAGYRSAAQGRYASALGLLTACGIYAGLFRSRHRSTGPSADVPGGTAR